MLNVPTTTSLVFVALLAGCGLQASKDFSTTPTPKLCMYLAENNEFWPYHDSLNAELMKRGEDCAEYIKGEMRRTEIQNTTNVKVNNN